jgi:ribosomal protein S18 acetylase RimI-like enzyme
MPITFANETDIPALVKLMDNAYRGEESKKGWTSEANLLLGDKRTDETNVTELMQRPGAVFLKYVDDNGKIEGCVFLHKIEQKLYLGMLCVSPLSQAKGIGKELMAGAESHANLVGCTTIFMTVISVRHELIAWYERKGYRKTGESRPFQVDHRFGIPTQRLEFIILEKNLSDH